MALRVDGLSYRLIAPQLGHEPRIRHGDVRSDGVVASRLTPAEPATGNDQRRASATAKAPILADCRRYRFSSAPRPIGIAKAIVIFRSAGRHDEESQFDI